MFKTVGPWKSLVVVDISVLEIVGFDCVSIAGTIGISTVIYERFGLMIKNNNNYIKLSKKLT